MNALGGPYKPQGLVSRRSITATISPPPNSSGLAAWYTGSKGTLDGSSDPQTTAYGAVATWEDQVGSYDLALSTGTAKLRTFARTAVYPEFLTAGTYFNQPDIVIDKRDASIWFVVEKNDLFAFSTAITEVLFELPGGVGKLVMYSVASGNPGKLRWIDGAGNHDTGFLLMSSSMLLGIDLSAAGIKITLNDQSVTYTALSAGTVTGFNLFNDAAATGVWNGCVEDVFIYDHSIAGTSEEDDVQAWAIAARPTGRGIVYLSAATTIIVCTGSSLATNWLAEDLAGFGKQEYEEVNDGDTVFYSTGYPAVKYDTYLASIPNAVTIYGDHTKKLILRINMGQTDIANGASLATMQTNRNAFVQIPRSQGWLVIENKVHPSTGITAGEETVRTDFNDWLDTTSKRVYSTAIVPESASLQNPLDTSVYVDGVHWNHLGHSYVKDEGLTYVQAAKALTLSSLKAWYPFDGDATDATYLARDLTEHNTPAYTTGQGGGQAIVLDGVNQYLEYDNFTTGVMLFYPMTAIIWIKTTGTTFGARYFGSRSGTENGWDIASVGGKCYAWYQKSAGNNASCGPGRLINDGAWHVLAMVTDAAGTRLYDSPDGDAANLVLAASASWTGTPGATVTPGALRVGRNAGSTYTPMTAQGMRIYNEALTLTQLQALTPDPPASPTTYGFFGQFFGNYFGNFFGGSRA